MWPNRGQALCGGLTRGGTLCTDLVIAGFDHCLRHVHPDQLEAAEAVAGFRICRRDPGCRGYAISWTDPPACKTHLSGLARQIEYRQYREGLIEARKAELLPAFLRWYHDGDRSPETLRTLGLDA